MKAVTSLFVSIPALLLVSSVAYCAETHGDTSVATFADRCTNTILAYRDGKSVSKHRLLSPEPSIYVGKDKYEVKIFSVRDQSSGPGLVQSAPAGNTIVGLIGKGPETNVETPHFKGICLKGVPHPSASGKDGEIEFSTADNVTTIAFRLNKIPNDPERLEKTSWKSRAHKNDTIWLTEPFAHNAPHSPPDINSWPTCLKPKDVSWDGGATVSFAFHDCSAATSNEHEYEYAVHMDRVNSSGVIEDVPIDPLIINHP